MRSFVVLLALACVATVFAADFTVTYDGEGRTVTTDDTAPSVTYESTALTVEELETAIGGFNDVPYSAANFSSVTKISDTSYRAELAGARSYSVYFVTDGTAAVIPSHCGPVATSSQDAFECYSSDPGKSGAVATYAKRDDASVESVPISTSVSDAAFASGYVSVAGSRAESFYQRAQTIEEVKTDNDERIKSSRVAVGFLYFWVACTMSSVSVVVGIWQSWATPVFQQHAALKWCIIMFFLVHAVAWALGFAGFIAILAVVAAYNLIIPCVYIYYFRKNKKGVKNENSGAAGATSGKEEEEGSDSEGSSASEQQETSSEEDEEEEEEEEEEEVGDKKEANEAATDNANEAWIFRVTNAKHYQARPNNMSHEQASCLLVWTALGWIFILLWGITFGAWALEDYRLVDRISGEVVDEFAPSAVAKSIGILYAFDNFASILRFDWSLQANTKACGLHFDRDLKSDDAKKKAIQKAYIDKYDIDMSIYIREDYTEYESVNDWFTRRIKPEERPVAFPGPAGDQKWLTSLADCRVTVFEDVTEDVSIWLKGEEFTMKKLLGDVPEADEYKGGSMIIFRLAPADYHRTHAIVSGTIDKQITIDSSIYSVGADAMRSENGAIYNTRQVNFITDTNGRKVAVVNIGATCVGSIVPVVKEGESFTRGDDFSYFQFGGSTSVAVFPPGTVEFDADLIYATNQEVEWLIQMGMPVGRWVN